MKSSVNNSREYNGNYRYNGRVRNQNSPEIINPERAKLIEEQKAFAETQKILGSKFEDPKTSDVESKPKKKGNGMIHPEHGVRYKKDGTVDKRYIKKDGSLSIERVNRKSKGTPEEIKAVRVANLEKAHEVVRDKAKEKVIAKFDEAQKRNFIQIIPIDSDPIEEIQKSDRKSCIGFDIHKIEEYAEDIVLFKKIKNIIRNGIQINSSEANSLTNNLTKFMEKYLGMIDEYDKFLAEYSETLDKYDECKKELEVVNKENATEKK